MAPTHMKFNLGEAPKAQLSLLSGQVDYADLNWGGEERFKPVSTISSPPLRRLALMDLPVKWSHWLSHPITGRLGLPEQSKRRRGGGEGAIAPLP